MIELRAKVRRWGNSFGIVVPQKAVESENVKDGDEVIVFVNKERDRNALKETFGVLKGWKIDAQKIKDELRREEREAEKKKWGR